MRIVSLVPSLTDAVAALGRRDVLVGVTDWCVHGAPDGCARVGGTKNPDLESVLGLQPDLVLANAEENRDEDLAALEAAGCDVWTTHPTDVDSARAVLAELGERLGAGTAAQALVADLDAARADAAATRPVTPVLALTLIWRKPWMGVGPGTYVDALLGACGFANALSGWDAPYPRLDEGLVLAPEVVLLPSEPYAFGPDDLRAVEAVAGTGAHCEFVDGEALTWHGPRTAGALRTFSGLAAALDARR